MRKAQFGMWRTDGTAAGTKRLVDAGLVNRTLQVRVLDAEGDGTPTSQDATAAAGTLVTKDLSTVSGTQPIEVDLTNAVRAALQAGKTRVTLRLSLDSPNPSSPVVLFSSTDPAHRTGLEVVTRESTGVVADLYDAQGARLAQGQSILDLRTLEAGTFYVRVYNPSATEQTGPLSFTLEAAPPIPGFSQPASDRDVIRGSDGDDILIGNEHLDRLFGERGVDLFVAEPTEMGEVLENGESRRDPFIGEETTTSQRELRPSDPIVDAYFHDRRAARGGGPGARHSGHDQGRRHPAGAGADPGEPDGVAAAPRPDRTRDRGPARARVRHEPRIAALAGNRVSELSPLAPATVTAGDAIGSPVGLKRLEHLSLDFNPVTDLSPLAELVNLKSLSVDGEPNLNSPQVNGILQRAEQSARQVPSASSARWSPRRRTTWSSRPRWRTPGLRTPAPYTCSDQGRKPSEDDRASAAASR